jgi:hypothetical protein
MRLRLAGEKPPLVVATAQFFANEPVFPKERLRGRTLPQGNSYVAPEHDHGRKCVQSGGAGTQKRSDTRGVALPREVQAGGCWRGGRSCGQVQR